MSQKSLSTMERAAVAVLALAALVSGLYFARKSGANPEAYSIVFNV